MVRADYSGDGSTGTRDGTLIYVCDRYGIRPCEKNMPLTFEAAWGERGAICVARPRVAAIVSLAELARRYPRLIGGFGQAACTPEKAARNPSTLLFNRSRE